MKLKIVLSLLVFSFLFISCKKTYDEGPSVSLRTKKNRMTGKWKLVKMSGVDRLQPSVDQYMELNKDESGVDYLGRVRYKAVFTNFQEEYYTTGIKTSCDSMFSTVGSWAFFDGHVLVGSGCSSDYSLKKKEGLSLYIVSTPEFGSGEGWKILMLTNKELKLTNGVCEWDNCYISPRTLEFEKVK